MYRITLITALIIISLKMELFAQDDAPSWYEKRAKMSKAEQFFSMVQEPNIRDFVWLKGGKMILELNNVEDFDKLKRLDSFLAKFRDDIAFYKDSLENNSNASVRIDYVMVDSFEFRQMRFIKHYAEGERYINRHGDISKLKIEQDTIRILMHVRGKEIESYSKTKGEKKLKIPFRPQYTIQVTFCLNNYSDIDKLIGDTMLHHIIDTLQSTKKAKTVNNPFTFPSSSRFIAYSNGGNRFMNYGELATRDDKYPWKGSGRSNKITIDINLGAGLVMSTIAPYGELGIAYQFRHAFRDENYFTELRGFTSSYFFFDKDTKGRFFVRDNWFVNADIGAPDNLGDIKTRLLSWGLGYLVKQNGDYFKGTTMKAFLNIQFKHSITLCPEIISTNNFKQIFPGITLKVF